MSKLSKPHYVRHDRLVRAETPEPLPHRPLPWRVFDGPVKVFVMACSGAWLVLLVAAILAGQGYATVAASAPAVPVILGAAVVTGWRWHRAALRRSR